MAAQVPRSTAQGFPSLAAVSRKQASCDLTPGGLPAQIYCTGHSMGGALALLAAYDISRAMEWVSKPTKVICYTFGAPRIGNHAFAHTYNKMVPETWNVVNDQVQ